MLSRAIQASYDFLCGYVSYPKYGRFADCSSDSATYLMTKPFMRSIYRRTTGPEGKLKIIIDLLNLDIGSKDKEHHPTAQMVLHVVQGMMHLLKDPAKNNGRNKCWVQVVVNRPMEIADLSGSGIENYQGYVAGVMIHPFSGDVWYRSQPATVKYMGMKAIGKQ